MSRLLDLLNAANFSLNDANFNLDSILGGSREVRSVSANTTLAADDAGKEIIVTGGFNVTLPLISEVRVGAGFHIVASATGNRTILCQGSDVIAASGDHTQLFLGDGDSVTLFSNGTSWSLIGGAAALSLSKFAFANDLAVNGYQRLPSGLILQWGAAQTNGSGVQTVTWPLAFTTAAHLALGGWRGDAGNVGGSISISAGTPGLTTGAFYSRSGTALVGNVDFFWFALGR